MYSAASTLRDEMDMSGQRLLAASGQIPMSAHIRTDAGPCALLVTLDEIRRTGAFVPVGPPFREPASWVQQVVLPNFTLDRGTQPSILRLTVSDVQWHKKGVQVARAHVLWPMMY